MTPPPGDDSDDADGEGKEKGKGKDKAKGESSSASARPRVYSSEELSAMGPKLLKELAKDRAVDLSGCLEKSEFVASILAAQASATAGVAEPAAAPNPTHGSSTA